MQSNDSFVIDMGDELLTSPYQQNNNPFSFTPAELSALHDPKNLGLLYSFGGLEGIAKGLFTNISHGLMNTSSTCSSVSLNDVNKDLSLQHTESASKEKVHDPFMATRAAVFGENKLPPVKGGNLLQLMWMACQDKTLISLALAAIVSLAVGLFQDIAVPEYDEQGHRIAAVKWVEGFAIIIAILVGSINDFQKEKQFRKLNAKKQDRIVTATREGKMAWISVYDIHVGDVLHLEPGDIAAADGILIEGHHVRCDESAATGESDAVPKQSCYDLEHSTVPQLSPFFLNAPMTEYSSLGISITVKPPDPFILSGSKVLEGVCTYLVTAVGVHSYHGRTMMALRAHNESTPLQEKLDRLASIMFVVFLIRYFVNWDYTIILPADIVQQAMSILIVVITIIVVAVPEGLLFAVSLALSYATQRMLKGNNLVRVLGACETIGNATTTCLDKTCRLAQNQMAVVAGTLGSSFDLSATPPLALHCVSQGIALDSSAFETVDAATNTTRWLGSKTDTALLQVIEACRTRARHISCRTRVPLSSERKATATVIRTPTGYRCLVKGASETLLDQCSHVIADPVIVLSQEDRAFVENEIQQYATRSLRTIGMAYCHVAPWVVDEAMSCESLIKGGLAWVGMEDPLRLGVKEAVASRQRAGVCVTGDNVTTATSIATQCGIYTPDGIAMEGSARTTTERHGRCVPSSSSPGVLESQR